MSKEELDCLKMQLKVLRSVEHSYAGRTIGNIIQQIEMRINFLSK